MIPGFYRHDNFVFEVERGKFRLFGRRKNIIRTGGLPLSAGASQMIEAHADKFLKLPTIVHIDEGEVYHVARKGLRVEVIKTHPALEFRPEWLRQQTTVGAAGLWCYFKIEEGADLHQVTVLEVLLAIDDAERVTGETPVTASTANRRTLLDSAEQWTQEMAWLEEDVEGDGSKRKSYMVENLSEQQLQEWITDVSVNLVNFAEAHRDML